MTSNATQTEREPPSISGAMVLRALAEAALIVDNDGRIRQINPAATGLLAIDSEALLDQRLDLLPGGAALCQPADSLSGTIEIGDRTIGFEKLPLIADEDQQQVVGTLIILRDLTAALAERRRQYDFFCQALHDVRVPLQAISGAAE